MVLFYQVTRTETLVLTFPLSLSKSPVESKPYVQRSAHAAVLFIMAAPLSRGLGVAVIMVDQRAKLERNERKDHRCGHLNDLSRTGRRDANSRYGDELMLPIFKRSLLEQYSPSYRPYHKCVVTSGEAGNWAWSSLKGSSVTMTTL